MRVQKTRFPAGYQMATTLFCHIKLDEDNFLLCSASLLYTMLKSRGARLRCGKAARVPYAPVDVICSESRLSQ